MFVVIDTETTGFSPKDNRIIEVGLVALDNAGVLEWEWSTLINPSQDVGASHIHGIYAEDVEEAPSFGDVAGELLRLLERRVLVAHNMNFDWGMLKAELSRNNFELPDNPHLCTAIAARNLGLRPYNLQACCDMFKVSLLNAHTALGDARATAELLPHVIDLNGEQAQEAVIEASTQVVRPTLTVPPSLRTRDQWVRVPA